MLIVEFLIEDLLIADMLIVVKMLIVVLMLIAVIISFHRLQIMHTFKNSIFFQVKSNL